jgi:hypothetical protein
MEEAMGDIIDDPDHWLERAEDARTIAKLLKDEFMKDIMEDIARSYEKIADHAGRNLKGAGHGTL